MDPKGGDAGGVSEKQKTEDLINAGFTGRKPSSVNGKPRVTGGHKANGSRKTGMAGLPEKKLEDSNERI